MDDQHWYVQSAWKALFAEEKKHYFFVKKVENSMDMEQKKTTWTWNFTL
jgi:hypothetical protein